MSRYRGSQDSLKGFSSCFFLILCGLSSARLKSVFQYGGQGIAQEEQPLKGGCAGRPGSARRCFMDGFCLGS